MNEYQKSRRNFIKTAGLAFGAGVVPSVAGLSGITATPNTKAISAQPQLTHGIQFGDVLRDRAIVWSGTDRPARMIVEYSFNPGFTDSKVISGPSAFADTDFTARIDLAGLPPGREVFVRVMFQDIDNRRAWSKAGYGHFRTAPVHAQNIRFLWSGDTCGQGWGINPDIGGMRIYETMRLTDPDFFIHCGDSIYADCPIPESQLVYETGEVWRNIVTPEVSKVAETLDEFRGRYKYNLLDHNVRRFNAEVPTVWLWDDHEVTNNWSPAKDLDGDARYAEKNIAELVSRAALAAMEFESFANGDGPVLGREFEIAELLAFVKQEKIANMVWFTADVHYCAAHYYDPEKARFKNFEPFWEFVSGPLNAGSFGPHELDDTFGPQLIFQKASPSPNLSPLLGLQFFGQVDIDGNSQVMTVALKDIDGDILFTQEIYSSIA